MNRSTWFLVFIPFVLCHMSEKSRDCCMYSSDLTNNFCPSNNSCSIRRNSNSLTDEKQVSKNYIYPENDQCQIISDSKKIQSDVEECFNADFTNSVVGTGKSLSEALIFASTNPKYDNRLFIDLPVQYMKIPSSNLGRTCCVQKLFLIFRTISYTTCSPHVLQEEELLTKIYL